eukprot:TRINITY_DN11268_c0_g1_i4.p1 TRINITY_DN11268_c0_g1~~TRINITY_DN11268_c0_g1_i4.p1  ORF type:complete len:332 (+),score=0.25 TRINITY_DN11268_c0_g1_i4:200-1195(+)
MKATPNVMEGYIYPSFAHNNMRCSYAPINSIPFSQPINPLYGSHHHVCSFCNEVVGLSRFAGPGCVGFNWNASPFAHYPHTLGFPFLIAISHVRACAYARPCSRLRRARTAKIKSGKQREAREMLEKRVNEGTVGQVKSGIAQEAPVDAPQNFNKGYNQSVTHLPSNNPGLHPGSVSDVTRVQKQKSDEIAFENSCKYRNVYKSIIRRMSFCIQDDRERMTALLTEAGFTTESIELNSRKDIEEAFTRLIGCKDMEHKTGNKKMEPHLIKEAVREVKVYTHILGEALKLMLNDWKVEKPGKVAKKNIETYIDVCKVYQGRVKALLDKSCEF